MPLRKLSKIVALLLILLEFIKALLRLYNVEAP